MLTLNDELVEKGWCKKKEKKGANLSTGSEMAESQMHCSVPCLPLLLQKVWSNWQITRLSLAPQCFQTNNDNWSMFSSFLPPTPIPPSRLPS